MPQSLKEIRVMLEERGLAPKKALGQNFLIDQNLVAKCADAAEISEGDVVLEVGPGTGVLTDALLARGARVVAIELDRELSILLRERLHGHIESGRFTLIEGDCLAGKRALNKEAAALLGDHPFKLVANLPYHAATPLMLVLMTRYPGCSAMHVTIQREVAERLSASPGSKTYGSVSVVAGCLMPARSFATLPAECFWPRPKVESAMVSMHRLDEPLTDDPVGLAGFCQQVFASRRKQLGKVMRALDREPSAWPDGVDRTMRIEQLAPSQIATLERESRSG
ncbi:MAG: 16S rRNA (adenine(1518)-N(6)/adenine(1519)-N(6))-dimethyltransferase RsmA [Planctomycetota bacterium]